MAERARSRGWISSMRRWLGGRSAQVAATALPAQTGPSPGIELEARIRVMLAEWQAILESLRACARQRLAQFAVFIAATALIAAAYLPVATLPAATFRLVRWASPVLGALAGLTFLILEIGLLTRERGLARRARQVETAMQVLLPGSGPGRAPALLTDCDAESSLWMQASARVLAMLYAFLLLAWMAALVATAAVSTF